MGTRTPFFATADHAAAKQFGRRHYKLFVAFRFLRASWVVWAALLVVGGVSGFLLWSPELPTVEIRIPPVPVWLWYGLAALSGLVAFRIVVRKSIRIRMFLFRIGL